MTPGEIRAVKLLASLEGAGLTENERHYVTRFAARAEREPEAELTTIEARYLRQIAAKHTIEVEDGDDRQDAAAGRAEAVEPAAKEAIGDRGDRDPSGDEDRATQSRPRPQDGAAAEQGTEEGKVVPLEFHPLANLFPLIEGAELDELTEDIRENGVRDEIVMLEGKILDGRNRYRSMLRLVETGEILGGGWGPAGEGRALTPDDLDPKVQFWPFGDYDESANGDPLDFVLSKNLHRRHLTDDQRRMVAAKLATMGRGRPGETSQIAKFSRDQAAEILSTDVAGVDRAKSVVAHGLPELVHAVESGQASVSAAATIARLDPAEQRRIIDQVARSPETAPAFRQVVKQLRREGQDEKKERRSERERELGRRIRALPDKKYGVILADPEWQFEPWSEETGMDRAPDNHYPTSPTIDICARPVGSIAADDSVLFLCATAPMLKAAIAVMEHWDFEYKTHCIWRKLRPGRAHGPGYWFTGEHELILVGTRGKIVAPAPGTQWPSVIEAPVGEHSEKPEKLYELIEAYFPSLPKIELNARVDDVAEIRAEWDVWGNEAPAPVASEAAE